MSKPRSDKSRAPTSPTNFGFDSVNEESLPKTKFSGVPAKHPARPAPSRSAIVPIDKRTSPFQTPAPTDSYKDVESLQNSSPKNPILPPSVPKTKPLTPYANLPYGRNLPAQVDIDPLPTHPPPQPPLQQKPIGKSQSRLPDNPPPHPFLKQKASYQVQNQKQTGISSADVRNKLPLSPPPPHPFAKKKVFGNLDPDQSESKQSVSKPQLPSKPPPHPFLKKSANDNQQQESVIVKSDEPKKPVKLARPIPTPRTNLSNQVMQTKQGEDKTANKSSAPSSSNLKGKPLVPPTKPKFSASPPPRNRIVTPTESGVTGNKTSNPLRPPIVGQKPLLSVKPQFSKDTVEPMDSSRMPLKLPSHSPQTQKQVVEPRPLPAPKPVGTPSVPVPPKKSTSGKVPLLPPGTKLR